MLLLLTCFLTSLAYFAKTQFLRAFDQNQETVTALVKRTDIGELPNIGFTGLKCNEPRNNRGSPPLFIISTMLP
ncbi:MAG: hypothetical protein CMG91_07780 [Marinobacter sp.]|nr:hypothetical protein [Marinobacter sp.]|tara:strand:- start:1213 stop:1434 length:222 start_codon:yes stop_codon:yes gene_type:complete